MPETFWTVRWPDGAKERCYSPSSVVCEIFTPGVTYPLEDFLARSRTAMQRASDRVKAKYGHPCSNAMAQLHRIETRAQAFDGQDGASVTCLEITQ
ncbi:MSMEG_0570 family nitrogen starvation response protein [Acuticoccus sediminis]|uniref:MSMEG_0570 family nitrogen starvation response protein n=1 Tax=Acuticoccus sediminis TaxID=2184697 RepID=A0A8B2NSQ6_9HYPH|nr:MSMEG_0570 family nitrogen starvation response protein [Acuticoccus sediminis]RAI03238.1 MSMEG_0570 family nitrogen starvation response protein [Acuticoccus sediminis]